MSYRMFSLATLALVMFAGVRMLAAAEAVIDQATHDGKVVSVSSDKLVMTSLDGKEHSHMVPVDAKVSCDGKVCKLSDLKAGFRIRVTTKKEDNNAVIGIEAIDKNPDFAHSS